MTEIYMTEVAKKLLMLGELKAINAGEEEIIKFPDGEVIHESVTGLVLVDEIRIVEVADGLRKINFLQKDRVIFEIKGQSEGNVVELKFDCLIPAKLT